MKRRVLFELCVETLSAVRVAAECSADRVELCSRLEVGGVTPPLPLVRSAVAVGLPVHVLIRPRDGDFVFSPEEFAQMEREIAEVKQAGAAAVVVGALLPDGTIDVANTRQLVELARPMRVTFHRAFDVAADQFAALEQVIETGADCLLTSGGAPDVLTGADRLAALHRQAAGRIILMPGGGLTLANLNAVLARTGVTALHGSLQRKRITLPAGLEYPEDLLRADLREALRLLEAASKTPSPIL